MDAPSASRSGKFAPIWKTEAMTRCGDSSGINAEFPRRATRSTRRPHPDPRADGGRPEEQLEHGADGPAERDRPGALRYRHERRDRSPDAPRSFRPTSNTAPKARRANGRPCTRHLRRLSLSLRHDERGATPSSRCTRCRRSSWRRSEQRPLRPGSRSSGPSRRRTRPCLPACSTAARPARPSASALPATT